MVIKQPRDEYELDIAQHFLLHPNLYIVPIVYVAHSKNEYAMLRGKDALLNSEGIGDWLRRVYRFMQKANFSHNDIHLGEYTGKSNVVIVQGQFRLIDLDSIELGCQPSARAWGTVEKLLKLIERIPPKLDSSPDV